MPDPACNPYLAIGGMLACGIHGIEQKTLAGPPVNKNIFTMSHREKRRLKIDELPGDLNQALKHLGKDKILAEAMGEHIIENFQHAKAVEWSDYISSVHDWERERYLAAY